MLESISFLYPLFQYHFPTAKKDSFSIFATSIAHFNENSSLKVENGNLVKKNTRQQLLIFSFIAKLSIDE